MLANLSRHAGLLIGLAGIVIAAIPIWISTVQSQFVKQSDLELREEARAFELLMMLTDGKINNMDYELTAASMLRYYPKYVSTYQTLASHYAEADEGHRLVAAELRRTVEFINMPSD